VRVGEIQPDAHLHRDARIARREPAAIDCAPVALLHEPCQCESPPELVLRGRGFGHNGAVVWCGACLGPIELAPLPDLDPGELEAWAMVTAHVHGIWFHTPDVLETWALDQLRLPDSDLNRKGRELARRIASGRDVQVWYYQFVERDRVSPRCPACQTAAERAPWNPPQLRCPACELCFIGPQMG
jgi:hypothetical protein